MAMHGVPLADQIAYWQHRLADVRYLLMQHGFQLQQESQRGDNDAADKTIAAINTAQAMRRLAMHEIEAITERQRADAARAPIFGQRDAVPLREQLDRG
jgi:virulence-associated protein VapD